MVLYENSPRKSPTADYAKLVEENQRLEMYRKHRARVQGAKSVVNSRPPVPRESVTMPKELNFNEILGIVRAAVQQNGNISPCTFSKPPITMRSKFDQRWSTASHNGCGDEISQYTQSGDYYGSNLSRISSRQPLVDRFAGRERSWQSYWCHNPADHMCTHHAAIYGKKDSQTKRTLRSSKGNNLKKHSSRADVLKPSSRTGSLMSLPVHRRDNNHKKINFPDNLLKRFELLTACNNTIMLRKLLRPKVFLDLEVQNSRPLGRLTIQLYTEACPEIVLEFLSVCVNQRCKHINLTRFFPPMWLEGELFLSDQKSLTGPNIEYDADVLDHGSSAGILSFPSRYMRGSKLRNITFSISFKPLKVLNGKRIAFGCVRGGHALLDLLQDYGTNTGRPKRKIVVRECGLL